MEALRAFIRLLGQAPRGQVMALGTLTLLSSATDGIGFVLLVPLLQMISGLGSAEQAEGAFGTWVGWLTQSMSVGTLLAAFVVLIGLRSLIQYSRETLAAQIQNTLVDQLRMQAFSALLGVEWRWLTAQRRSDHASLLLTNIGRVGLGLGYGISLMANLAVMLVYLIVAFLLSPQMTLLVVLSGAVVVALLSRHRSLAYSLGTETSQASRALHGNVQESLAGIKMAKILNSEQRHIDALSQATRRLRENQAKFVASTSMSRGLFHVGGAVLLAAYIYFGLLHFAVPVPELLTLVLIFARLIPMFITNQQQFHRWMNALPALEETEALLAGCLVEAEPEGRQDAAPRRVSDAITLENVSLYHNDRSLPALKDVSLSLPARTTTAVMGPSGAGKSTLADVVMGLLAPDAGRVLVDGIPLEGPDRSNWRRSVAYVPQETFLFHDSIRTNLMWSKPDATEADLRLALRKSAAAFVFDLPDGLDTVVGDAGHRLSGGERQRLALARALLQEPALLILDEATSALDMANEARIREAIEQLHGDLTVLIIGHRLPTLEHADQVVLLDQGQIVAKGTWSEVKPLLGGAQ
jgi:ATP-binding cassette subfamily C protein